MTRRRMLFGLILVAVLALAFWDHSRSTESTLRATVTDVSARDAENGPDQWFMTVTFEDQTQTLGPLQARPTEAVGDTICIIQSIASHRDPTYRRAPAATRC